VVKRSIEGKEKAKRGGKKGHPVSTGSISPENTKKKTRNNDGSFKKKWPALVEKGEKKKTEQREKALNP